MKLGLFFHQRQTVHYALYRSPKLSNTIYLAVATKKHDVLAVSHACIPSHFQQIQNGLNFSRVWWIMPSSGGQNNLKRMSSQKMGTFNNASDVACYGRPM